MLDPLRMPLPEPVRSLVDRFSGPLSLPALPLHAHEVVGAIALYTLFYEAVSPAILKILIPQRYAKLNRRNRIGWNIHVVGTLQALLITAMSFYVIFHDDERRAWRDPDNWEKRIWGYSGLTGLLQSFALGFFLWDLYMCVRYVGIFGPQMIVHAFASATMFTFGFVCASI
jgi:hypothetical protein